MNFSKRFVSFAAVLLIGCVVVCAHADAQKLSESINKASTSETVRKKAASSKSGTTKFGTAKSGTAKSSTAKTGTVWTDAASSQKYSQKARTQDSSKSERILETVNNTQIVIVDENDVEISPNAAAKEEDDGPRIGLINIANDDDSQVTNIEKSEMTKEEKNEEDSVFTIVEQQAEFPGGQEALMKWLASNIRYPETAAANGIQGRVIVKFVVGKDGSISNVKVLRGADLELDLEAVRVIRAMPKWTPARNNGETVRCYYTLPVTFSL